MLQLMVVTVKLLTYLAVDSPFRHLVAVGDLLLLLEVVAEEEEALAV